MKISVYKIVKLVNSMGTKKIGKHLTCKRVRGLPLLLLLNIIKRSKVGYFQGVRQITGKELLFCFIVVEQYILFSLGILDSKKIKRS